MKVVTPFSQLTDTRSVLPPGKVDRSQTEVVRYAGAHCSLGYVLVANAARGICAILLGDDGAPLFAELRARFPRAILTEAGPDAPDLVAKAVQLVEAPAGPGGLGLELDLRGTAFQRRVWKALQQLLAGETISYGELARRVGNPRAVRAVANACAANPVAVAVPCHRVIGSDGRLTGYRWGVDRKRLLLEREQQ